jgi:hypothetical protein
MEIWGQCSKAMKARVKMLSDYIARTKANDCSWLLQNIRAPLLSWTRRNMRACPLAMQDVKCSTAAKQGHNQTISMFKETLNGWAEAIRIHGGTVAERISSDGARDEDGNERTATRREEIAMEETLAMLMVQGADLFKYGTLIADILNQFVRGKDEYAKNMASAETLLELYLTPVKQETTLIQR